MIPPPRLPFALLAAVLAGAAIGCTSGPFVFKKNEFNRNDPGFNKPITDRDDVTICYSGIGTSDGRVASLAQDECARFGKRAQADGESFGECPLSTPVAARFLCVAPEPAPAPATEDPLPAASGTADQPISFDPRVSPVTVPTGARG